MAYRVKNITTSVFSFENVVIQPGKTSGELPLDVYQRLLALNHGTSLLPVEDSEYVPEPPEEVVEEPVEPVAEVPQETKTEEVTETQTVEVQVPEAAVAAEPEVEAPKRRGRPRKNQ